MGEVTLGDRDLSDVSDAELTAWMNALNEGNALRQGVHETREGCGVSLRALSEGEDIQTHKTQDTPIPELREHFGDGNGQPPSGSGLWSDPDLAAELGNLYGGDR